jgi:branched-chain amino acid transport system ATP-binding protein
MNLSKPLLSIIEGMVREGSIAVILVEQRAHQILSITKQALVLERGRVVHQGPSDVLEAGPGLLDRWLGVAAH